MGKNEEKNQKVKLLEMGRYDGPDNGECFMPIVIFVHCTRLSIRERRLAHIPALLISVLGQDSIQTTDEKKRRNMEKGQKGTDRGRYLDTGRSGSVTT